MDNTQIKQKVSALINTRQIDKAEALLKPICNDTLTDANLWQMYANINFMKGNLELVEKCCHQVIKYQPDDIGTLFNLGCLYVNKNNIAEAQKFFNRVINLNPKHSLAQDNLGQLYEANGHFDKAKVCFKNAIEGDNVQAIHYRHLGVIHLKEKNPDTAEKFFTQGMALDKTDAKAHVELGRAQCENGKKNEAIKSFKQALQINPEFNYAKFWLSAISDQPSTNAAKHRFVSRLFDGHAEDFDKILVNDLGYKTPWLIANELSSIFDDDKTLDILDIGCGTGLCADSLKSITNSIVGIDLSEKMLAKAKADGNYTELLHGDIVDKMSELSKKFELIVAADVFVYVGGLTEVFDACKVKLTNKGLFIFSVENSDHENDFMLRATGRYAHSLNYIKKLTTEYGFEEVSHQDILLRTDGGKKISGQLFILRLK